MTNELKYRDVLYNDVQLGPYPLEKLRRVAKPTNAYVGPIARRDPREHALAVSGRGDYGEAVKQRTPLLNASEPLNAALAEVQRHINTIAKTPVAAKKAPIPDNPRVLSRHIKSLGYFLGADIVGICRLPESAVYANDMRGQPIQPGFRYAIVALSRKMAKTVNASNGFDWIFGAVSFQAYQRLACQTETMANYIRRLGYEAEASNLWNYLTLMPQLIIEAGLGEVSRMGIAVNPFIGANFKAAAVLTNLPLEVDLPTDFGLQEYCQGCRICVELCPSKAIPEGGKTVYNGYETWKLDERRCSSFSMLNSRGKICGRCTAMCPWNRPDVSPEHYADWDGNMDKILDEVNLRAQQLKEHNYSRATEKTDKWWFDLDLAADGSLIIPLTSERLEQS
ncbi:MAG: 4Fe-4S dicluster domain-containing protein [Candidatus Korobacteraceae bacterium]